ncbi:MAG TPA: ParB N-terminal domain-containing protein [Tepidisphaeraceae bacterium]|nr:ParB N-terminal domain-containing protein [Tepidisphaeraceae bacterium]
MTIETISIDSLSNDPANARIHSPRNLDAIKASLKRFGQQKPIVVDQNGIVRAGNGTLAAAKSLGWKQINIIRTVLSGSEATAYAIADNRTSDLSEWDDEALARQLDALRIDGIDLSDIGFDDREVSKLLDEAESQTEEIGDEKWLVVVTCNDEADQLAFLDQMQREERTCKAVVS